MDCKFEIFSEGILICPTCGRKHFSNTEPSKVYRKCRAGKDTGGTLNLVLKIPKPEKTQEQKDREIAKKLEWPKLVEASTSFLGSMGKAINQAANGEAVLVTVEDYQARTTVCDGCPFREGKRCKICSCNLPVKARLAADHCPLAKWVGDPKPNPEYLRKRGLPEEVIQRHVAEWESR